MADDIHAPAQPDTSDFVADTRVFESLTVRSLLSFGGRTKRLLLANLNVLVGPNGSGKSNLIEVIDLLRSTPSDIVKVVSQGGGAAEWIWKGAPYALASIGVDVLGLNWHEPGRDYTLRHTIRLRSEGQRIRTQEERVDALVSSACVILHAG